MLVEHAARDREDAVHRVIEELARAG